MGQQPEVMAVQLWQQGCINPRNRRVAEGAWRFIHADCDGVI
jgi:hypothetical protein